MTTQPTTTDRLTRAEILAMRADARKRKNAYDISDYQDRMRRMERYVERLADELLKTGVVAQEQMPL